MDNWEIYYRTHAKGVGKELTGSPPLSFVSNGQPLADYRIYGASGGVGDRTENLFDKSDIVEGYFININGVVNQNENFCYTNFISVTNGLTYSLGGLMTKRDSWTLRVHGYNSSGNWISEIGEKVIIDAVPISLSFTLCC